MRGEKELYLEAMPLLSLSRLVPGKGQVTLTNLTNEYMNFLLSGFLYLRVKYLKQEVEDSCPLISSLYLLILSQDISGLNVYMAILFCLPQKNL